jgi:NAD(P)-dependent dehydrogenase (short-subunit alcohol dehydrogenase family)
MPKKPAAPHSKSAAAKPKRKHFPAIELRRMEDQVVLVTGGNRGIGLAIARALAREGATVIITGRDEHALRTAREELTKSGGTVVSHVCDIRDEDSVDQLFSDIGKHFPHLDVLINNAGIAHPNAHVDRFSLETWRSVMDTNLTGAFLCTRAALPLLRRGSTIVNNVSVAATTVFPGMSAYGASKAALLAFTNALREELRPREIRVIAFTPGATNTDIWKQFWKEAPRERMMSAESVADALVAALSLPANATVQDLVITPTQGAL